MTPRFAVIGYPISHSLSPKIHYYFAQQFNLPLVYEKITGLQDDFEQQVAHFFNEGGKGMNVTLPFKQRAYEIADIRSARCEDVKAANTLWLENGSIYADNTDGAGFIRDVSRYMDLVDKKILILGAGGAARGIISPVVAANPSRFVVVNRTPEKAKSLQIEFPKIIYADLETLSEGFDLIINATSAGLSGLVLNLPGACFVTKPFCYDLTYHLFEETPFVHYAKNLGCGAVDGLGMLVEQAAESFSIWNNRTPLTAPVLSALTDEKHTI